MERDPALWWCVFPPSVPPQEHDGKHDDHNHNDRSEADKHGFLLSHVAASPGGAAGPPAEGPARRAGPVWSVLEGVLDLRPGLLGIALELVTAALSLQAPVAGQPAGGLLGAAFDYLGLMRNLLSETHRSASRRHPAGVGASAGTSGAASAGT